MEGIFTRVKPRTEPRTQNQPKHGNKSWLWNRLNLTTCFLFKVFLTSQRGFSVAGVETPSSPCEVWCCSLGDTLRRGEFKICCRAAWAYCTFCHCFYPPITVYAKCVSHSELKILLPPQEHHPGLCRNTAPRSDPQSAGRGSLRSVQLSWRCVVVAAVHSGKRLLARNLHMKPSLSLPSTIGLFSAHMRRLFVGL